MKHPDLIDIARQVVRVRMSGVLTCDEILVAIAELNVAGNITMPLDAIVDVRDATFVASIRTRVH